MILFAESISRTRTWASSSSEESCRRGPWRGSPAASVRPGDLPQALVNRGLIGKEALSTPSATSWARGQSVFVWEGGAARFSQGWLLQEIFETDVVSTFEILLRGIFHMNDFAPIKEAMRGVDNRLKLRTPTRRSPWSALALSPTTASCCPAWTEAPRVDARS